MVKETTFQAKSHVTKLSEFLAVSGSDRPEPVLRLLFQPFTKLFSVLAVLGLVVLGLFSYYVWLVMSDNLGTFHNTTDLADLDGDGDLDVILHNVRTESEFTAFGGATLWFNQDDGQFVAVKATGRPGEGGGWASAAGDVDRDGDGDLFVFSGWLGLRLILNQGGTQGGRTGEFRVNNVVGAPEKLQFGQFGSVLLGDLNDDGQVDGIVVGCCGRAWTLDPDDDTPNISWVWINEWSSRGGLAPPYNTSIISALEGLAMRAAALGDLDGDGDLDLFTAVIAPRQGRNRDPADRVLFNDGSGNFTDSGQRLGETDSTAVALGDLDGDGDLDALVGTGMGSVVWINQGETQGGQNGAFALSGQKISGGQTTAVFLSDLDGDGDLDALVGGRRQATIWWNDGQAAFTQSSQRFRYSKKHGLAIGDFNSDGQPDIFAGAHSEAYSVWFNQGDGTFRAGSRP
ncbi:MAG: VCBS repeat-containing protein [Chloroflexota bacterium]|nr:VCBS repeat-containing protein [Chloroflexota bacterium]